MRGSRRHVIMLRINRRTRRAFVRISRQDLARCFRECRWCWERSSAAVHCSRAWFDADFGAAATTQTPVRSTADSTLILGRSVSTRSRQRRRGATYMMALWVGDACQHSCSRCVAMRASILRASSSVLWSMSKADPGHLPCDHARGFWRPMTLEISAGPISQSAPQLCP